MVARPLTIAGVLLLFIAGEGISSMRSCDLYKVQPLCNRTTLPNKISTAVLIFSLSATRVRFTHEVVICIRLDVPCMGLDSLKSDWQCNAYNSNSHTSFFSSFFFLIWGKLNSHISKESQTVKGKLEKYLMTSIPSGPVCWKSKSNYGTPPNSKCGEGRIKANAWLHLAD